MQTNWQERHNRLAQLTNEFFAKQQELELIAYKMRLFVDESDRLSLSERNMARYCRLTEDVTIEVRWENKNWPDPDTRHYKAGTLVEGRMPAKVFRGSMVTVYLDDDGDGFLDFPAEKMEVVEINYDDLEGKTIINQG